MGWLWGRDQIRADQLQGRVLVQKSGRQLAGQGGLRQQGQ